MVHPRPRRTSHSSYKGKPLGALVIGACTYSGDSVGNRGFDSNMLHFLILIKAFFNIDLHTLSLGPFVPLPWLVMNGYVEVSFGPRLLEVHPTNSQSMSLPVMGFKYINSLPPIQYCPFRPKVGIMAHLVMSDLLIYPFSFNELTHT